MGKEKLIVKLISWYYIIVGTVSIVSFLAALSSDNAMFNFVAPIEIVAGIGMLKLKNWARILGIAVSSIVVVTGIVAGVIIGAAVASSGLQVRYLLQGLITLVFVCISIFIIRFLIRPNVKEQFK